jgi:hypothetical protein
MMVWFWAVTSAKGQGSQQPHRGQETWYEFVVRQFNPHNFDYGGRIEKRRRAFLDATAKTPYFWYSFGATTALMLLILAYAKLYLDNRRNMWITSEMIADVYNHDLYSRDAAREAIEKYNKHIEQCNRAIEAAESTDGRPGWGETGMGSLRAELQRVAAQLEATTQDRNKLQEELTQKSLVVADLSLRLEALSKKVNGNSDHAVSSAANPSPEKPADGARFVGHINRLQEELYAERQKNRRLKGA